MDRDQMVSAIADVIEEDRHKRGPKVAPEKLANRIMSVIFPPVEDEPEAGEVDTAIMKTCSHPTRIKILRVLANSEEPLTPSALAETLGLSLGSVSYHVRGMADREVVELDHTEPVRGALAHYYKLTSLGMRANELLNSGLAALPVAA